MRGITKSKGNYVLLLDSDQELEPRVVEKCIERYEKHGYDALILKEESVHDKKSWISKLLAYNMQIVQRDADV